MSKNKQLIWASGIVAALAFIFAYMANAKASDMPLPAPSSLTY